MNAAQVATYLVVKNATKNGLLSKAADKLCEECGSPAQDRHHEDYAKPLEVNFLCRRCHKGRHKTLGWGIPFPSHLPRVCRLNKRQRIERARKAAYARARKLTRKRRIEIAIMGGKQRQENWRNGAGNSHDRRKARRAAR